MYKNWYKRLIVKGEFKCFGTSTQIKDKYGTGYDIEI